ncbi:MAG: PIN domain-containing protein [Mobilicoccus sp.]|nr:PIN domain-containing protein [Mobilicoccus sp.]
MAAEDAVLLDTNAYSALFVTREERALRQGHPLAAWRVALRGRRVVIAFQTRAELLIGARSAKWGRRTMERLVERLGSTPTIQLTDDVLEAYVALTAEARDRGLGIGGKSHVADRWIAACAIAKSLPLLSGDGIFRNAPSLTLLEVPEDL